jgi:hypothetical protein
MRQTLKPRWIFQSILLGIILLATGLRWWRLPSIPPGLWRDEAYNAMDARWLWETGSLPLFLVGNTGREPLLHYLGAPLLALLGNMPYAFRLVPSIIGILTIAVLARWMLLMFAGHPDRYWLALVAAAGLTVSLWHVVMSRSGYRADLVPFLFAAMSCFFWLGWFRRSWGYFLAAGATLGVSQYSYLSARMLPLTFIIFIVLWLLFSRRPPEAATPSDKWTPDFRWLLVGLALIAIVSAVIFLPLGWFFWQNPAAFIGRTSDVGLLNRAEQTGLPVATVAMSQLTEALRVFFDGGQDSNWRHTLVGVAGFDWVMRLGFWAGLIVAMLRLRQPRYLWLLSSLVVLWLPVLLSQVGTLRLSGFFAPYYALMAVGWVAMARWLGQRLAPVAWQRWMPAVPLAALLVASGGWTAYNYFIRWNDRPQVYEFFNGQLVDFSHEVVRLAATHDLLLPFELYTHPTFRFMLVGDFEEVATPPVDSGRPALQVDVLKMVDVPPDNITYTYVWLTQNSAGQGVAYTLPPFRSSNLSELAHSAGAELYISPRTGRTFARLTPIRSIAPLLKHGEQATLHEVSYRWGDELRLTAYEVLPADMPPGPSPTLNLYWQNLTDQPLSYNILVQLTNDRGEGIAQWTDGYLADQHRWRAGFVTPTQHRLWLDPQAETGPYLVQISLYDPISGHRLPIFDDAGNSAGDQVRLGLFYVTDQPAPRHPEIPLETTFGRSSGDEIQLLGVTLPPLTPAVTALPVRLYWQTEQPLSTNYTAFVQLLNSAGERVAGWDAEPLQGQYPTSLWQPQEVVVDTFTLPLPETLPPDGYQLVTGFYDFATGERLPATAADGATWPNDVVVVQHYDYP